MNICKSLKENVLKNVNIFSNSTILIFQIFFWLYFPRLYSRTLMKALLAVECGKMNWWWYFLPNLIRLHKGVLYHSDIS
jgi:hypothetical protein